MSGELQHAMFLEQLNSTFHLHREGSHALDLELTEVSPLVATGRQEYFSIVFRGPPDLVLPQQIYALEHAALGCCDLFLVPIRQDPAGVSYEAVFNRLVGPDQTGGAHAR